jgi:hypothetical protein
LRELCQTARELASRAFVSGGSGTLQQNVAIAEISEKLLRVSQDVFVSEMLDLFAQDFRF